MRDVGGTGALFVCCHRTLLEPIFISIVMRCPVTAVTYSLSYLSELLSPIPTMRLTRDRVADATSIVRVLAICPDEGTTYRREPFLLLFSALFIELTDDIMPVAMVECRMSVFYGTTAKGIGRRWISSISSSTQAGSTGTTEKIISYKCNIYIKYKN
jgi:hypothetical protein